VATGVDRIRSGLGRNALRRLQASGAPIEVAVDELTNALAVADRPVVIVLDDLHVLSSGESLASVEYAVEHLPAGARVIAMTRTDPPISLGRLRGRGALREIRSRDLAFTVAEARTLLVELEALELDDVSVELLVQRTEGWPAGLYLAALWLRGLDDPRSRVEEFAGDHRHVADYLTGEVLDTLDADQREFLLRTSVLDRFTAPLCDAVLDRRDSAVRLSEIERRNLFLVSLDPRGEWYRYHHLFADLLQLELGHTDPDLATALRRRAARWFRHQGLVVDAAAHAAAGGDEQMVAELLVEYHVWLVRSGREATLLRWVAWLPEDSLLEQPGLVGAAAIAAGLIRRSALERHRLLALVERTRIEHPEYWSPYAEAMYRLARAIWIDGDVGLTVSNARTGVEVANGGESELPALACLAYSLLLTGDFAGARVYAERAIQHQHIDHRSQGVVLAFSTMALVEVEDGNLERATALTDEALARARATGVEESWMGGIAHVAHASVLAGRGRLKEAEREAERGELLRRAPEPSVENTQARLLLAEVRLRRGRLALAAADLEEARRSIAGFSDAGRLPAVADRVASALAQAARDRVPLSEAPTDAELAVLQLLPAELSQREIGAELYLSMNTVKTHVRELYRKLGVRSRPEAVARAVALGLLEPDESPR
jgi:LuxR family maltose regulon positive regulatory protein